jgi:hypothetical protein
MHALLMDAKPWIPRVQCPCAKSYAKCKEVQNQEFVNSPAVTTQVTP